MLLSTSLRPHHLSMRFRRTLIGAASCRVAGQQTPNTNPADKLGGSSLSDSLGSSKSQSSSDSHTGQYQPSCTSAGIGKDDGDASSTTQAAISGIAGNTAARTGDNETGIAPIFDADKVQKDINAQVQITQVFGQQASKAVGDYAQRKLDEALLLRLTGHEQEAQVIEALWGETGSLRLAAHTVIGGLTGGSSGAAGAAVGTLTAPAVADALAQAGIEGPLASTLTALASTATGAAVGGTAGGAAALNEAENNYLAHWQQELREQELALAKSLIAQGLIQGKWAAISTGQDAAYLTGMGLGAAKELVDMVRAIPELPQAVASLLQDPSALKQLPTAYALALEQSHSNYLQALDTAGVEGATAAGVYFVEMASLLASPAVAGSGTVKLGQYGIKLVQSLEDAAVAAKALEKARVNNNFYAEGHPYTDANTRLPVNTPVKQMSAAEANQMLYDRLPEGIKVEGIKSADELNAIQLQRLPQYEPSLMPGTKAVDFITTGEQKFVRVFNDLGSDAMGTWVMRAEDIEGLSMVQIAEKYALPKVPQGVADVKLPAGTPMRASVANDILLGERFGGAGAGVQFEIRLPKAELDKNWFKER